MESDEEKSRHQRGGTFRCSICDFNCRYDYCGRQPPYSPPGLRWMEDIFSLENPGELGSSACICLGSCCCACGQQVCADERCSLFYSKRFCKRCVAEAKAYFPAGLQKEVSRLLQEGGAE
mmetsp:Transcript_51047/g.94409  ORF Transcript_51047/g.94409 Transcript_51047/m.94409 type:complete len:120 (+) Transcript_51047:46-405(+)